MSVCGQICFGILFEEGYEFLWDNDEYDGIEDWWLHKICGIKNQYEHLEDVSQEKVNNYWGEEIRLLSENPLPITPINYGTSESAMYIIAIPKTCLSSSIEYPESFSPKNLSITEEERKSLIDFCEKYCRPVDGSYNEFPKMRPKWYLSSYYGI